MANFDTLKAQIAALIPDNTEQEITAKDVRDAFGDTIDAINAAKEDEGAIAPAQWGGITGDLEDQTDLKNALDAKQNTISDLATIQSGAAAGATAVQPGDLAAVATSGDYDDLLNKPTIPPGVVVDQTYDATSANAQSGVAMAGALAGKEDTISDLSTIRSGAAAGATAVQPGALAAVATSGQYSDLTGTPTIPAAPGTLNTDNSTAQTAQSSEALSGTVKLHKVSKTGSYNDLTNKPTIPAAQVNADWDAESGVAQILNKPTIPAAPGTLDTTATTAQATSSSEALSGSVKLHKISKTGKYSDLSGKPTVPVITLNGSTSGSPSFYAPTSAGTLGQVLTSNGSGAPTWQAAPSGGGDVTDVTLGGTSVVDGDGVAVLPAYPVLESLTTAEIDTIWAAA
jgi:hypothetical protein